MRRGRPALKLRQQQAQATYHQPRSQDLHILAFAVEISILRSSEIYGVIYFDCFEIPIGHPINDPGQNLVKFEMRPQGSDETDCGIDLVHP